MHITNIAVPEEIEALEKKVEESGRNKLAAAHAQDFERAAAFRDEENKLRDELRTATERWEKQLESQRETVDEDKVAEVVAMMTGVPVQRVAQAEGKRLMEMATTSKKPSSGKTLPSTRLSKP